jgi:hypothetical protein
LPWEIPASPQSLFQNETILIEVANTAYVKVIIFIKKQKVLNNNNMLKKSKEL